ncbi:hypothetical protein Tco_0134565 [Tanacetum coccineum]
MEVLKRVPTDEDKEGKAVDPSHYRGIIGTILYLTASRPDLQFAICMCARYQARPTKKHLNAHSQMRIMLVVKIHVVARLEVCNFWVINLLAGRLKGRKALRYPVRKLNILLCPAVISRLYALGLLDAACKKVLNLLKKGLLKVEAILKSAWTEKDQIDNFLKERRLMRSLESSLVGDEHAEFDESNENVLERFYTSVGNPVKEILLNLNLPDHRILKDGGEGT